MNYQRQLDELIANTAGSRPGLALHACCAPCASSVLEYLTAYFDITVIWYNANIQPKTEHDRRKIAFVEMLERYYPQVELVERGYHISEWGDCEYCQSLRIRAAAELAAERRLEYFGTTLSVSPHKNAAQINRLGFSAQEHINRIHSANISWLPSDFKKRNGYLRSIELSRTYGLYRQRYCGCIANYRGDGFSFEQ